ncbi:long-chain-fatty-acid--CoA ligase [Phytomonospora endophytica]|uniref:Long-chain acyl-CoA synthetase n=1 Tax=Phytomonospora endophytica TaxID=714109 RepID=A0A841FZR2_9ACTN|nr:long-chain fatty acid--CoA ligase [Phytomonospora endophytica]MBB6039012.1 long-chain acyl-CoA synthetase [Phytomonospora endophytica]GIG69490.1 long-chain-fatty-acid--CoA ligase [Phytomonospora endophytica]
MLNLAVLLEDSAREFADRDAVVLGPTRLTYAQVDAAASQVAHVLAARGIGPGDRVALTCPNLPYFPIAYYGILKTGAAVVPLNVLLNEREIAYHLADSGARAYLCFEGTAELPMGRNGFAAFEGSEGCEHFLLITADPAAESPVEGAETLAAATAGSPAAFDAAATAETDTAVVLYTSGTTGRPKGAELSHSNMVQNAILANRLFGTAEHEVHLLALPLFHSFGQSVQMNAGFSTASTLVLLPRFDAGAALGLMRAESVSFFAGVPTMFWALLNHPDAESFDLAKIARDMRIAVSGGSALPLEVLKGFEERFGVPILEGYGLSETSPIATFNRVDRPRRPGSIGLPVWGVQVKVTRPDGTESDVDEPGEIRVRGHNVMKGYLNRPQETAEVLDGRGWFRTGDVARRDADGYFYIVDRIKDLIIRGGFNVYPREVEEVLLTHPDVSLAAVIGVPHESQGEEIKAYVIRKAAATVTEDELIAWCRENMAAYKYPRIVEFRDALPMTATGKILKRELAAELEG